MKLTTVGSAQVKTSKKGNKYFSLTFDKQFKSQVADHDLEKMICIMKDKYKGGYTIICPMPEDYEQNR